MAFALRFSTPWQAALCLFGCCAGMTVPAAQGALESAPPAVTTSVTASVAVDQPGQQGPRSEAMVIPQRGELNLTPRLLLQMTLARNADALYSRLAAEVSGHLAQSELGLFEVVAFGGVRHEDRERQRTAQERLAGSGLVPDLDEQVDIAELGVRRRLRSGGELSLSYRLSGRDNNLIKDSTFSGGEDTEYDGALALTFKQPLLRGFGRGVVEADRRIAELEWAITKQQHKQQLLRTSSEALAAYWQLYRAHESLRIREQAMRKADAALEDIKARISSGRLSPRTIFEARSAVATRRAEVFRAEQNVSEAEAKIKNLLNLNDTEYAELRLLPILRADQATARPAAPILGNAERLEQALQHWPTYRIADLKRQQGLIRLDYASNQKRPQLDLTASCSSTYLSYDFSHTAENVVKGDYPDCYLGFNMEIPLEGNLRAKSQHQAQYVRLYQSALEIEAVRTSLANDLELRTRQLERVKKEVAEYQKDVELRQQLLDTERQQFQFGMSRLSQVIARENELNAGHESLLDSQARLELAQVAVQVADGSLFGNYAVEWRGD